ncbi:protein FAM221B isoform X5 [Hemicordylus capensis]|uniref:protein FAM221B isoform X5 n=1 Tax=Hemicordylus capensis TaxID=884348 RepID=UPI002302AE4A|nr:protein FAM221B isoform X5 [Hemicordylus capensis]
MEEEEEEPMEEVPEEGASEPPVSEEEQEQGGEEEEDAALLRTSSTALEVEEELIVPTSTTAEDDDDDEDTLEPRSTTSREEGERGGLRDTSLLLPPPPSSSEDESSESGAPREQRSPPSGASSPPPPPPREDLSSAPSSLTTSPLPWKVPPEEGDVSAEAERGLPAAESSGSSPPRDQQLELKKAKKKVAAKKGALNYTVRPVVPAEKAELLSVAKAMHRENFGKNVKELFHLEKEAALRSIETERRATVPCTLPGCRCPGFTFIPSHPEEVGEFWLRRRTGFDPAGWRAKCRCKHTHEEHAPAGARSCGARGCSCSAFASNFLCAACDRRWEEHETFFESEDTRRKGGRPWGEAYLPFAEMPDLRNAVLTGRSEDDSAHQALLVQGLPAPSGSRALPLPPSGPRRILEKDDKKA